MSTVTVGQLTDQSLHCPRHPCEVWRCGNVGHSTSPNVGLMLVHRLRRWPSIGPSLSRPRVLHQSIHTSSTRGIRLRPLSSRPLSQFQTVTPGAPHVLQWLAGDVGLMSVRFLHCLIS